MTVSEDKTVRLWDKDLGCLQKVPLQATTLWSVAALDNGNFVVGASTGHAYVFSNGVTPPPSGEEASAKESTGQEPTKA